MPAKSQFDLRVGLGISDFVALAAGDSRRLKLRINPSPPHPNDLLPFDSTKKQTVLLTGATGYVGMHILHCLLEDDRIEKIYVILRSSPRSTLEERLDHATRPYRLHLKNKEKLFFISGDISMDRLGVDPESWRMLASETTLIIHSASSTNHAYPYPHFRNTSVRALLDLAALSLIHRKKQLHIIGSVGCEAFQTVRDFYRFDFYRCGYTRMKWIVKHLAPLFVSGGISAHTYMLPFVLGSPVTRYKDPGLHYAFWQMVRAVKEVDQVWDGSGALIPVIPATTLADAIIENAFAAEPLVWSYPALNVDGLALAEALNVPARSWQEFRVALTEASPFLHVKKGGSGALKNARLAMQKALFVRALFPKDFPAIMQATSNASKSDVVEIFDRAEGVEYLRHCLNSNSII
jgi:nucleoside-diphosphate-sugar epimerase